MIRLIRLTRKNGSYSLEAAIILPFLILSVITFGYLLKADSMWEENMHNALDRCSWRAATPLGDGEGTSGVHTYNRRYSESFPLPESFTRAANYEVKIKYRDFCGYRYDGSPMGSEDLETPGTSDPVWIFPKSGTRYHKEHCTYVKATVRSCILTGGLKKKYSSCGLCHSSAIPAGSIVFCFNGENTAYHCGNCPSIDRHVIVVDKKDAIERHYLPCSKCGG